MKNDNFRFSTASKLKFSSEKPWHALIRCVSSVCFGSKFPIVSIGPVLSQCDPFDAPLSTSYRPVIHCAITQQHTLNQHLWRHSHVPLRSKLDQTIRSSSSTHTEDQLQHLSDCVTKEVRANRTSFNSQINKTCSGSVQQMVSPLLSSQCN